MDLDLWLMLVPELGWRVVDQAGLIRAAPDATLDDKRDVPPLGGWRSAKDGRSYAYDLWA